MDRTQLLWQMTAEQFAAFDTQLYLDTHYQDANALYMFGNHRKNYNALKSQYEAQYGPISADSGASGVWAWINDPWPWEREAN